MSASCLCIAQDVWEWENQNKAMWRRTCFENIPVFWMGFCFPGRILKAMGIAGPIFGSWLLPGCVYITQQTSPCSHSRWRAGGCTDPTRFRAASRASQTISEIVLHIWLLYHSYFSKKMHFKHFIATAEATEVLQTLHLRLATRVSM